MYDELVSALREDAEWAEANEWETPITLSDHLKQAADAIEGLSHAVDQMTEWRKNPWIPVTERLPSDFVSVQAHIVGAEPLPTVREAYVIGGKWFFPALKEFLPVDKWARFSEPPKEET